MKVLSPYTTQEEEKGPKASELFHLLLGNQHFCTWSATLVAQCPVSLKESWECASWFDSHLCNWISAWSEALLTGISTPCLASVSIPHFEQRGKDGLSDQSLLLSPNICNMNKIKQERKLALVPTLFRSCWATGFDGGLSHLCNISCGATQAPTCPTWKPLKLILPGSFLSQPTIAAAAVNFLQQICN